MILRKDSTAIALALEIDSEGTIHGPEAEAAFEAIQVMDLTAHAHGADSDLETDVHDGIANIHVPVHPYEICRAYNEETPNTH